MQNTVTRSARSTKHVGVRVSNTKGSSAIPANINAAAQLIYFAVMDPACKEVREALDNMGVLDHDSKMLHLEAFHKHVITALPVAHLVKGGKRVKKTGGAMNIQKCILLGILVLLLTVASYIISVRSEMSIYQAKCANVMNLFDPARANTGTFFNELNKFTQMVFNKEHIEYCQNMQDKYGSLGIYLAKEINKTMGTLKARLTASFAIVTAITSILHGGIHALVCIAARWIGEFDTVCGETCTAKERKPSDTPSAATKRTRKSPPKKEETDSSDDEEEEEDDD